MDFDTLYNAVSNFYYQDTILSVGILLAVVILVYLNPKKSLKFAVFLVIMGVIFYIISLLGGTMFTGVEHTEDLTHKSKQAIEDVR